MRIFLPMALGGTLLPALAFAHPHHDHAGSGFTSGLAHPLLGLDHVLAMVAVGLWAAVAGGRALWAGPLVFLGAMLLAGLAGAGQPEFALAEHVIIASVIITGLAVALAMPLPLAPALAMVAVFGLAHGYAHGVEGPGGGAYAAGFVLATAALHGLGIALARLGPVAVRVIGGGVALGGAALAVI